jgi:DNA-binding response OmpR family regulator
MPSSAVRILAVDPDEAVCALIRDTLESEPSVSVSTASGGPDAHAALREGEIGLVLVDGRLPGVPGTPAVAAHADKLGIPVIVMAAEPDRIRPNRGVVRGLIAKPFQPSELAHLVAATLALARRRGNVLAGLRSRDPEARH